ncbi:Uncharacterised protein [Vibrio cholerae]|nr:Uncharacterised protein [Vibrio cholerae]
MHHHRSVELTLRKTHVYRSIGAQHVRDFLLNIELD